MYVRRLQCVQVGILYMYVFMYVNTHVCTYVNMYAYMNVCMHVYMYVFRYAEVEMYVTMHEVYVLVCSG